MCSGPGGKAGPGGQELVELAAVQANSSAEASSAQCSGRTAGSFEGCLILPTGVGGRRLWAAAVPGAVCRTGDALTDGGARARRSACCTSSWSDAILPKLSVATATMPQFYGTKFTRHRKAKQPMGEHPARPPTLASLGLVRCVLSRRG